MAMSVLWGLTGSLDARMVGDAKSADVTFDSVLPGWAVNGAEDGSGKKVRASKRKKATVTSDTAGRAGSQLFG